MTQEANNEALKLIAKAIQNLEDDGYDVHENMNERVIKLLKEAVDKLAG